MGKRHEEELLWLQQELLAAEEEDEAEYEAYEENDEAYGEDFDPGDWEDDLDIEEEVPLRLQPVSRYRRGSQKRFDDPGFFEDNVEDEEFLSQKDFKRAKKKKARKNLGLVFLAVLELLAIAGVLLWWSSWAA